MFNPTGYGYPQQPMMQYNGMQPQQQRKVSNNLTADEIAKLQANKPQFNLAITEDEHLRAMCNHRSEDGMKDTLDWDPQDPNAVVCKICGWKFTPINVDSSEAYVQSITDEFINLLQTIKILFADFPTDAARSFFDIIPLAKKTPELFNLAVKSLAKYDNNNMYGFQNQSNNAAVLLGNFMGAMGSNMFGGGYQQPFNNGFQQPQQQPMMGANPVFGQQNAFGYPGASQFGYQAPQPGYQPGTQGFQYTPGQQAQPAAAPAADAAATTTTTTNNQA